MVTNENLRKLDQRNIFDRSSPLKGSIVEPSELSSNEIARMYELMGKYYTGISAEQFKKDLSKKHAVILLRTRPSKGNLGEIQGFSTLLNFVSELEGYKYRGIFSGDTVLEKQYWGSRVLGKTFLIYLFKQKLKNPFSPLYWFLISKGYKTYLLMANNFSCHYPRFEKVTPTREKKIMDRFYSELYPSNYKPQKGLIEFDNISCHLKQGIASVCEHNVAENPRIAFFSKSNPNWKEGSELTCIAKMTLLMPFYYAIKSFLKTSAPWFRNKKRHPSHKPVLSPSATQELT